LRDAVCLNAGAALWLIGMAVSIEEGFGLARKSFVDGSLAAKVNEVKAAIHAL
jgi:anthranilate synthase/phosphoribosyltransferase